MSELDQIFFWIGLVLLIGAALERKRWKGSGTSFGTARWAIDAVLERMGMLAGHGLLLGRTVSGKLLWLPKYTMILLVGGTGTGKGVSFILPNLILGQRKRRSMVIVDVKGELFAISTRLGNRSGRLFRLAPFNDGNAHYNSLDEIPRDSPILIDEARATSESLISRAEGARVDPHWDDRAVAIITAILVLVLRCFNDRERTLCSVQAIVSDTELVKKAAAQLESLGGLYAQLGAQLWSLFDSNGDLTREGSSIVGVVLKNLSFLDSVPVAESLSKSTFKASDLLKAGTTLYLQIPFSQIQAQRNLLRCWMASLIRTIGEIGDESHEVLFIIDEAPIMNGLTELEAALTRGRSSGIRILAVYQSISQVMVAFKDKSTLLQDNCDVQIYVGAPSSLQTATMLSQMLGERTELLQSYSRNSGHSSQSNSNPQQGSSSSYSYGETRNYSEHGRALLRPEECLQLNPRNFIAFVRGVPPILGRRVLYYSDPLFKRMSKNPTRSSPLVWVLAVVAIGLVMWGINVKEGWEWQRLVMDIFRQWGVLD